MCTNVGANCAPALDRSIVSPGSERIFSYAVGFVNKLPDFGKVVFGRTQFAPTKTPQKYFTLFRIAKLDLSVSHTSDLAVQKPKNLVFHRSGGA